VPFAARKKSGPQKRPARSKVPLIGLCPRNPEDRSSINATFQAKEQGVNELYAARGVRASRVRRTAESAT
jgi:hypothetical protein